MTAKDIVLGVDAANLRQGGGITHLIEVLRAADPYMCGIKKVIVWGGEKTLALVEDRPWLEKETSPALNGNLVQRSMWQRFALSRRARETGCDALFVPGGTYVGDFRPVITMSRNMLPFEWDEIRRYGLSPFAAKLVLLRLSQSYSYHHADGVIFLTDYARRTVIAVTGELNALTATIPHGLNSRFSRKPEPRLPNNSYSDANPYRVLYVSAIDHYKHQSAVIQAIAALRKEGLPVSLELIGPAYPPALKEMKRTIRQLGDINGFVSYHGSVPFEQLHRNYREADIGLFASSCENMPNILLETMASGLPIACSNRGPMPEVLQGGGVYFDPERYKEIADAVRSLIMSPELRKTVANQSYGLSQQYSWSRCALSTFDFLSFVARRAKG